MAFDFDASGNLLPQPAGGGGFDFDDEGNLVSGAPKAEQGDLARGFQTAFEQLPQLGYGLVAGAGAALESVTGEGGIASGLKKAGVKGYQEWGEKIAASSKESDSLSFSWEQAKQGDFGALADWLQYGLGYAGGQAVQMLATAGVGSLAGKAALKTAADKLASGMVTKEAARLAEAQIGQEALSKMGAEAAAQKVAQLAATPELAKLATANVASKIGQVTAVGAQSFGMEGGEIFGGLVSEAEQAGRQVSGSELAKAFGATLGAGALEFAGDKIGLDLMLGKSALLKPAAGMPGKAGRAARGLIGATAAMPIEGGTEYLQTGVEAYGQGKEASPFTWQQSEESQRQAMDAAGLGALGGAAMGGAGGVLSRPQAEKPAPSAAETAATILAAPSVEDAIAAAEQAVAAPPAVNPFDERLGAFEARMNSGLLAELRQDPAIDRDGLLMAYRIAKNPRVSATARERALGQVESFLAAYDSRPDFTLGGQEPAAQPGTALATTAPQAVGAADPTVGAIPGEATRIAGTLPGAPRPLAAPPVRQLTGSDEVQRQAAAEYEAAFQDLVKAEQLGAADADLLAKQQALRAAEARLQDLNALLAGTQETQSAARRDALLESTLANLRPGESPARAFGRALHREGFRETAFSPAERAKLVRFLETRSAFTAAPETEAAAPNELDPAALGIREKAEPQASAGNLSAVDTALARGFTRLNGRVLANPKTGKVMRLSTEQLARAKALLPKPVAAQAAPLSRDGNPLRVALLKAMRTSRIRGMENEQTPDPIAQDTLRRPEAIAAIGERLAAMGITELRPLAGGVGSVVLDAGDRVVRLGLGEVGVRPNIPEVLQAEASGSTGGVRYEVLPKAETSGITDADVAEMGEALRRRGYEFSDAGTDNLGRVNGRLVVIDPGAVIPAKPATLPDIPPTEVTDAQALPSEAPQTQQGQAQEPATAVARRIAALPDPALARAAAGAPGTVQQLAAQEVARRQPVLVPRQTAGGRQVLVAQADLDRRLGLVPVRDAEGKTTRNPDGNVAVVVRDQLREVEAAPKAARAPAQAEAPPAAPRAAKPKKAPANAGSLLHFLKAKGVLAATEALDLGGDKAHVLNRRLPGLFRKAGLSADAAREVLQQHGWLEGVSEDEQLVRTRELISQALRGNAPVTQEQDAVALLEAEADARAAEHFAPLDEEASAERLAIMAEAETLGDEIPLDQLDALLDTAWNSEGATDETLPDWLADDEVQGRPEATESAGADDRLAAPRGEETQGQGFALAGQTDAEAAAEFARAQEEPELSKAQIDREAAGFTLSGESQANPQQAPTGGQGGLFTADGRATQAAQQAPTRSVETYASKIKHWDDRAARFGQDKIVEEARSAQAGAFIGREFNESAADFYARSPSARATRDWLTAQTGGEVSQELADVRKQSATAAAAPDVETVAATAEAILDAAGITGSERLNLLKDVKRGEITPEELARAHPAKELAAAEGASAVAPEETKADDDGGNILLREEQSVYTVHEPDALSGDLFQGTDHALPETAGTDLQRDRNTPRRNVGVAPRAARVLAVRQSPDVPGLYHVRTQLVTVGERALPVKAVRTWGEAAQAFAHLTRYAVEHLDGLVTDRDGKPLAIIGAFKGAPAQATVYPSTVMMELARIDGAAHLWLSHNHPSGTAELSGADRNLSKAFADILRGSSVEYHGLSAMARRGNTIAWQSQDYDSGAVASDQPTPYRVPIVEREIVASNPREGAGSPAQAKRLVADLAQDRPGVVFLTAQNEVSAFVPVEPEAMGELRSGDRLMRLFAAASQAGANAAFVAMPDGQVSERQFANLKGALGTIDVRVLDGIGYASDGSGPATSLAELGRDDSVGAAFFRRGAETVEVPAVSQADAEALLATVQAQYPQAPALRLAATFADLPADVRTDAEQQGVETATARGALAQDGTIWLIRENHTDAADLQATLFHELLGHAGIRKLFGPQFVAQTHALFNQLGGIDGLLRIAQARGFDGTLADYIQGLSAARAKNPARYSDLLVKAILSEEVLAHIAEQPPTLRDRFRALLGRLRAWLRKSGFAALAKYNESDLLHLLAQARANLQQADTRVKGDAVVVFNRKEKDDGKWFWDHIAGRGSVRGTRQVLAEQVLHDALAGGSSRRKGRNGYVYRAASGLTNDALVAAYWDADIAGFTGYYTRGFWGKNEKGQNTLFVAVVPSQFVRDDESLYGLSLAELNDKSILQLSLVQQDGSNTYELGVTDPDPGSPAYAALEKIGRLRDTGQKTADETHAYKQVVLDSPASDMNPLFHEAVRRLALAINAVPSIEFSRETGANPRARKTKLTPEQIVARFRRSPGGRVSEAKGPSTTAAALRQELTRRLGSKPLASLLERGLLRLHATPPEGVRPRAKAYTDGRTLHLIAANLPAGQAWATLQHEGIHHWLEGLDGTPQFAALMGRLDRLADLAEKGSGSLSRWFEEANARINSQDRADRTRRNHELAAYAVEVWESEPRSLPGAVVKWVQDLVAAAKTWLAETLGFELRNLTAADLAAIARRYLRTLAETQGPATAGEQSYASETEGARSLPPTLTIDGVERPTTNSEGRPIAQDEAGVRAFYKWFGSSQIVDGQGRPLVVYHGTGADFDTFSPASLGSSTNVADAKEGFFFTTSGRDASEYAWKDGAPGSVMPVYLRIENPHVTDMVVQAMNNREFAKELQAAKANGNDGAAAFLDTFGRESSVFVAFRPEQIKSVNNRGTFDPADANILLNRNMSGNAAFDPSATEAQQVERGIEGQSMQEAVKFVMTQGTPAQRTIASRVLASIRRQEQAGIRFELKIAHTGDEVPKALINGRGLTQHRMAPYDNHVTVWLNGADLTGKVGVSMEILLHELVHAATMTAVHLGNLKAAAGTQTYQDVGELFAVSNHIIRHLNARSEEVRAGRAVPTEFEARTFNRFNNAFADANETIAWALSNPEAQAYLETIAYPGRGTTWSAFVAAVRRLLGLPEKMDTALAEVLRVSENLMSDRVNELLGLDTFDGEAPQIQMPEGQTMTVYPTGAGPQEGSEQVSLDGAGETITLEGLPELSDNEDDLNDAERVFLSSFPASTRTYRRTSPTARAAQAASLAAGRALDLDPFAARAVPSPLGPFAGYETSGRITRGLDGKDSLVVQVYGQEQSEAGLDFAPALTLTIDEDGEFAIYGPPSTSPLYREFARRGWAELTRDADGNPHPTLDGGAWTKLTGATRRQAIDMMGDAHARAKNWLGVEHLGLHWKRTTGATGNREGREGALWFSEAAEAVAPAGRGLSGKLRGAVADLFDTSKTFNWWQRSVGTQYGKAKADPDFGRVYGHAHAFIDDTSRFANEAADLAPGILPHMDSFGDVLAGLNVQAAWADAKDYQALAPALFEGTLVHGNTGKVWSDTELTERFKLNPKQIGLYREARAAINHSLETLAASELARAARSAKLEIADPGMAMDDAVAFYADQVQPRINAAQDALEEIRLRHAQEKESLDSLLVDETYDLKAIQAAKAVRNARQAQETAELRNLVESLTTLRDSFTSKADTVHRLQREGYAPLMRFGQYTVDVSLLDADGKPVKDAEGNPLRPFFGMFESEGEAQAAAKILAEEYPEHTVSRGVLSTEASQLYRGLTPETAEMFARLLGTETGDAFQAYLQQAVNNRSAMKRLIQRQGIAGFANDVPRVLSAFVTSNARLASGNLHFGEMAQAIEAIPKVKGDVKDEAIRLMQYIQNPREEAAALRGFLFFNFLGGSIASAAVNLTQSFTTTLPYLHQFGSQKALSTLPKAMKLAAQMMGKGGLDSIGDPALKAALHRASEEGIIDPQEIHLLMAESGGAGASGLAGRLAGAIRKDWAMPAARVGRAFTQAWGSLFGAAEKYNRHVAFIAAWEMWRPELAQQHGDRFSFASQAVTETQFDYSKASRANWGRGPIGATLMTFKTFTTSWIEFLGRLPPRERALAVAVLLVAAGLSGAPGADDLDDLVDTLGQKLGYNWNNEAARHAFLVRTLGIGGANFIEHGVSSLVPLDVSARLGMGNLIPGTGVLKKSTADKSRDVQEFFGPAGSLLTSATKVWTQAGSGGDLKDTVAPLLPKAVADFNKALEMAATGHYTDTKGRKVVDVSTGDALIKGLGFQPNTVAEPRRVEFMLAQSAAMQRAMRSDIYELWAEGRAEKDEAKVEAARQLLRDWNAKNPDTPIRPNMASIMARVRALRLSSAERLVKATPKEMRGMLAAELEGR